MNMDTLACVLKISANKLGCRQLLDFSAGLVSDGNLPSNGTLSSDIGAI